MMFTIDLLKGQGIPDKSKPGGLVILTLAGIVPIVLGMIMFILYMNHDVAASAKEKEIARLEVEISRFSGAVKAKNAMEEEKSTYRKCLSEVKSSTCKNTQWSPVLTTLVENIPESVVLTSLEVSHDSVRKKVPKKDDPKKKMEVSVPVRVLRVSVTGGHQGNCDRIVKEFIDRLWASDSLGPRLEKIGHSQRYVEHDGKQLVSYEISCLFKPSL